MVPSPPLMSKPFSGVYLNREYSSLSWTHGAGYRNIRSIAALNCISGFLSGILCGKTLTSPRHVANISSGISRLAGVPQNFITCPRRAWNGIRIDSRPLIVPIDG